MHNVNPEEKPEMPLVAKEEVQQEKLEEEIVACMRRGEELPDTYIQQTTREALQHALKRGLVECIEKGQWLSKKYTELTDAETWDSIKANHQEEIKLGFALRVKEGGDFPRNLLDLATEETWDYIKKNHQEEIRQGMIAYAARRQGILAIHLKLLNEDTRQSIAKEHILKGLATGTCHTDKLFQLLSEKGASEIRDNNQSEIVRGILLCIRNGSNVPSKYLDFLTGDNLQNVLVHWLPAEIAKGNDLPKKLAGLVSKDVLATMREKHQEEIGNGIAICVRQGKNIPAYLKNLATNDALQAGLLNGFAEYTGRGARVPEYYLRLATESTVQTSLKDGLKWDIKHHSSISPFYKSRVQPEDVQSALKEAFVDSVKSGDTLSPVHRAQIAQEFYDNFRNEHQYDLQRWLVRRMEQQKDIPQDYSRLATENTMQSALREVFVASLSSGNVMDASLEAKIAPASYGIIKKEHQTTIQEAIMRHVQENLGWPATYARLATKETVQAALKQAFVHYVKDNKRIPVEYLDMATDETLEAVLGLAFLESLQEGRDLSQKYINHFVKAGNLQRYVQSSLLKTVQEGRHPTKKHSALISDETLSIFENESVIREAACQLTGSFFNNPKEVESEIKELLSQKDSDWIKRLVFDRTLLSVGIKIHTRREELGSALKKTGGFVAHGKDTCFVANPVPNKFVLEIAMEALKKKIDGLEEEAFFQTCVPQRLSNECCGIATVAFLLTKTNNVKYDKNVLQHNQGAAGLTIYDAGGRFEDKFYVPKAAKDDDRKVVFDGRTDIVLCTTIEDIQNAHLLLSLLAHASYEPQELRFKALGQQFVSEFKATLERHGHADWLQHNFVNANTDDVGKILLAIAEHREEVSKTITNYNAGVRLYSEEVNSESGVNAEEIRKQLESMKKSIDSSFWFDIKALVERYENRLYPDGMYIHSLTGEYS